MRSLFVRLLVSLWATMTVLVGIFALIHAWSFPNEALAQFHRTVARSTELRGEQALRCAAEGGADCGRALQPIDKRDTRVAVWRDGSVVLGEPIPGAAELAAAARAAPEGFASRNDEHGFRLAVVRSADPGDMVLAAGPTRSIWTPFVSTETLPLRLAAIVLVTGLVSVLLARWLSRPVRALREATLQMAQGDLSTRVSERLRGADGETRALGHDFDRMAERIQALLEGQRRLLRDVSHELRSPLARLGISLELVRRKSSADVAPALDRIERETERLNQMIGELLTLSRLEAGDPLEQVQRVDVAALVGEVVDDATVEADARGVRVEVDAELPGAEGAVAGNQELLRRALENVVRNAVRFSEAGSTVHVSVDREPVDGAAGDVRVRVRDHGPGVPEGALEDIFKPFFRVDDSRACGKGGTGIGLAITHRAVELHGGRVRAANLPQGGLEVTVRLPAS